MSETKILLIKESTKPTPHFWKLVSEKFVIGESILDALVRGVGEEAGLKLKAAKRNDGSVSEITDPQVLCVRQLIPSHIVERPMPHRRHFWGILTTNEVIESLSGKYLSGDDNEELVTMDFDLVDLDRMVDLLPHHRELIQKITHPERACPLPQNL